MASGCRLFADVASSPKRTPFVDYAIGNWQVNGILSARSGQNINITAGGDIANTGNAGTYERANLVGIPTKVALSRAIHRVRRHLVQHELAFSGSIPAPSPPQASAL